MEIGSYKGFTMFLSYDAFRNEHTLTLKGAMSHTAKLGLDARGNLTRIDNALNGMQGRSQSVHKELENLYNQQAAAKVEVQKPFMQEQELKEKIARLAVLDEEINMSAMRSVPSRDTATVAKRERPSILKTTTAKRHYTLEKGKDGKKGTVMANRQRNIRIQFRVTEQEKGLIEQKMQKLGTKNTEAYLRKMAINRLIIYLDTADVRELVRVLRVTSNSLNQFTKWVHGTGSIYGEDIDDLRKIYDGL